MRVSKSGVITSVISSYDPLLSTSASKSPAIDSNQAQTIAQNHIGLVGNAFYKQSELVRYYNKGTTRLAYQTIEPQDFQSLRSDFIRRYLAFSQNLSI